MIASEKRGDDVAVSAGGEPPALLTNTSKRPCRSSVAAITASIASGSRTSAATNDAARPAARGSSSGSWRQHTTTSAPASRKRLAIPAPSAAGNRP